MHFICQFEHRDTGVCKTFHATLMSDELRSVEAIRVANGNEQADLIAEAYALRRAYAEAPEGFLHTEPPQLVAPH